MFRLPEHVPAASPLLPPDLRVRLSGEAAESRSGSSGPARGGAVRLPAHSRDERRLARIDRKVAARDAPPSV